MDIEHLKQRYSELSTDELLHICVSSELTEEAKPLMIAELNRRNINSEDIAEANKINDEITRMEENISTSHFIYNRVRRMAYALTVFGLIIIIYSLIR